MSSTTQATRTAEEHNAIRRAAKAKQRANRPKNTGTGRENPAVNTGLRGATARRREAAEAAVLRLELIVHQAITGFDTWTRTEDRAIKLWTEDGHRKIAHEAITAALTGEIEHFDWLIEQLPERGTYRNDVRRRVVLTATKDRLVTTCGITFAITNQSWFTELQSAIALNVARRRETVNK